MLHICISYMFFKMHKLPLMYPIFSWNAWWFSKYIDHSYLYWFSMMYWTTNLKVNSVLDREPSLLVKSIYFDKFQQIFRNKSRVSKNIKFSCFARISSLLQLQWTALVCKRLLKNTCAKTVAPALSKAVQDSTWCRDT